MAPASAGLFRNVAICDTIAEVAGDLHLDIVALGVLVVPARDRCAEARPRRCAVVCGFSAFQPGSALGSSAAKLSAFFWPISCEARSSDCLALVEVAGLVGLARLIHRPR